MVNRKKRDTGFIDFVLDQLRGLRGVNARAMFGGYGLYYEGVFFSAVAENRLFFRVSDQTRPRYEERGMTPFAPYDMKPMRSYYEVPSEILESPPQLMDWARDAVACAKAVASKKKRTKRASPN